MSAQAASISPAADVVAADLHLLIDPAEEDQGFIGQVARAIPRSVQALSGVAEWVGDEALAGDICLIAVASRDACPTDEDLAGDAQGHGGHRRVEQVDRAVGQRAPEKDDGRRRVAPASRDRVGEHAHRGRGPYGLKMRVPGESCSMRSMRPQREASPPRMRSSRDEPLRPGAERSAERWQGTILR